MAAPTNGVQLNRLSDHDLLISIAQDVRCLPELREKVDRNEERSIRNEERIGHMARISTAISAGMAFVAGLVGVAK